MCDGGLGWIGGIAITFAVWRRVAALACSGTRGRDGRGWGLGGIWGRNGIQGILAVPYVPVQGSPGVFWESLGVGDRVFGWVIIICSIKVAYMRMGRLLKW